LDLTAKQVQISDIGKVITGKTPSTKNPEYFGTKIPFLTPSDISESKHVHKTERSLSESGMKLLSNIILPPNSIAVSCIGSDMGKTVFIKENMITNQQFNSIIPNSDIIDPEFLYYFFKSKRSFLRNLGAGGSAQPIVKKSLFEEITLLLFSLESQRQIGKILSKLDTKIQNLQNQNRILEQTAQAIFQSWFVDFDGVTEWDDSELGKIPKGWKPKKLGDFISVEKGLSYKGKFLSTSGIPLVNLGNIEKNGGFIGEKIKHYTGEFKTKHVISSGDIVIANTDITQDRLVLGSPALIPPLDSKEIIFTHHIFAVRNNSGFRKYFLYYLLKTQNYHQHVTSYAMGTTVLAIPKEAVLDFQFGLPNDDLINKFDKISSDIHESLFQNNSAIHTLTKTRDTLLPKLMSGEIRV